VVVAGAAGALFSFVCVFVLLCIVMYVGIPWACIALFRGSGIGNAMAMTLNTASNIMSVSKAGQGMGKNFGKSVSDSISRATDKNKGANTK